MQFFTQECWSGLPFPLPGHLPDLGIEPKSCISCIAGRFFTIETSGIKQLVKIEVRARHFSAQNPPSRRVKISPARSLRGYRPSTAPTPFSPLLCERARRFHRSAGAQTLPQRSQRLSPLMFAKLSHCLSKTFPDSLIHRTSNHLIQDFKHIFLYRTSYPLSLIFFPPYHYYLTCCFFILFIL
ncbi:unnamed protein product [Rangifer tarandus platyrhynchus]|uniref:Uncharacterized protein n=1 Tax=Rangifer tarandus platyrhynchus TaxID=3082113 RepID=A0AC59YJV4_RANTA